MSKQIYSLSINARMQLNLHDLNNEGGEGNQTLTRYVTIINKQGDPIKVNAVSGDMLKHIQSEHLWKIAKEKGLPLCNKCKIFDPNRIGADKEFIKINKGKSDKEVIDNLLQTCVLDDLNGILITDGGRNTPRKSVVEFGWLVGIPEKNFSENYIHTKLVADAAIKKQNAQQKGEEGEQASKANEGQNIFYRPANSGEYAFLINLELFRISFNDIDKSYPLSDEERINRYKTLLQSIVSTVVNLRGAMRNTQNPHNLGIEGVISISTNSLPAPQISPLEDDYKEQIEGIKNGLNKIKENSIETINFSSYSEFVEEMQKIMNEYIPYKLS